MWLSDVSVKRPVVAIVLSLLLCVFILGLQVSFVLKDSFEILNN